MLRLMTKSVAELLLADVDELCSTGAAEGQFLDFKENLSGKGRQGDDWNKGSDNISERATLDLARSIVAFANADGGWVVLGIRESSEKPARAEVVTPLRDCHDLARRLRQSIYERIDPAPIGLEAWGVETYSASRRGVVVFRIAGSAYAPHGVRKDEMHRACFIRRNDECRLMTMRDIQERTLEVARGLQGITASLDERRKYFEAFHVQARSSMETKYRITAVPTRAAIRLERIYLQPDLTTYRHWRAAFSNGRKPADLIGGCRSVGHLRPMLRGARATGTFDDKAVELTLTENGMVELLWVTSRDLIPVGWLLGDVLHALDLVDKVRARAGQPEAEYLLDIEIVKSVGSSQFQVTALGNSHDAIVLNTPFRLPPYSIESPAGFGALAKHILADIDNAGGKYADDGVTFER